MSIIIKSNQLNFLVYKYLLEAGLEHTAYTLFNQAVLSQAAQQFKYDVKAGHLLTLLERSLIFTQIEQHMNFSQYMDCEQPFHLLKKHTCSIIQKIKEDKEKFYQQLSNNINDSMRRTNMIYHTQVKNKEYQQIVYQPRGTNYLEKCPKIKLNKQTTNGQLISLEGTNTIDKILINDQQQKSLTIIKYDPENLSSIQMDLIFPGIINNECKPILKSAISPITQFYFQQFIIQIFQNNFVNLRFLPEGKQDTQTQDGNVVDIKTFQLQQILNPIDNIEFNPNFSFIVSFSSSKFNQKILQNGNESSHKISYPKMYSIINLKNMKKVIHGYGIFLWRFYSQYIVYNIDQKSGKQSLTLKTLKKNENNSNTIFEFNIYQQFSVIDIKLSQTRNYFSVLTKSNKIYIYTFQNSQPLYTIIEQSEMSTIKRMIWCTSKQVDYLTYLTDNYIKLWQIELTQFSKKIQTKDYDLKIKDIVSIKKNQKEGFVVALGQQNLLVYDISLAKAQRISLPQDVDSNFMKALNKNVLSVWNQNTIYLLSGPHLQALFL